MKKGLFLKIYLVILITVCNINVFAVSDAVCVFTCDTIFDSTVKNECLNEECLNLYGNVMLRSGISGNSLYFDGSNAYLKGNSTKRITDLNKWTATLWIKPDIDNAEGLIPIAKNEVFSVNLNKNTKKIEILIKDSSDGLISNYTFNSDVWNHIALSYDSEMLKLYVNGKVDSRCLNQKKKFFDDSIVFIGKQDSKFYKGCIDEIAVYAKCLSATDIADLYKGISGQATDWNFVSYPLRAQYPNGIETINSALAKESEIVKPIDTGFEERNEIGAVKNESYNGQLKITEEKYSGKFALEIIKRDNNIIPIKETDYFKTSDNAVIVPNNTNLNTSAEITGDDGASAAVNNRFAAVEEIKTKCNFFEVMLKPMYLSEEISFYTKAMVKDSDDSVTEKYVIIKSDNDGDGIFKVGEDFSRGKWQMVKLNLLDVDETFESGIVSGLYISANDGSHWIFDNITSGYKKINETNANMSEFIQNNVIYTTEGIKFAETETSKAMFNNAAAVVTGGVSVSEIIAGIDINSDVERASGRAQNVIKNGKELYSDDILSEKWIVNDINYDETEAGVSKKRDRIFTRDAVPSLASTTVMIPLGENEKQFRLCLTGGQRNYAVVITKADGETITQNLYGVNTPTYTEWFDGDITLKVSGASYNVSTVINISKIQYIGKEDITEIILKPQGEAIYDLNNSATDDRVTIKAMIEWENGVYESGQTMQISLY